jgi:hypothetical protein
MYSSQNSQLQKGTVKVILVRNTPMVVNGNVTGRMYVFRNKNDVNWVDNRDAISMKGINGLQVLN